MVWPAYHGYRAEGDKYKKSVEWGVPVVNIQWLNDIVLGDLSPLQLPIKPMYQQFNGDDNFKIEYTKVASLMGKHLQFCVSRVLLLINTVELFFNTLG